MTSGEMTKLYDAVLSVPGMNDPIKVNFSVPRKLLLLLSQVIEIGFQVPKEQGGALFFFPDDASGELRQVVDEILGKAGLNELNEKLRTFNLK